MSYSPVDIGLRSGRPEDWSHIFVASLVIGRHFPGQGASGGPHPQAQVAEDSRGGHLSVTHKTRSILLE